MILHKQIEDAIKENEIKSVRVYSRRQQLEMSRQQLELEIKRVEQELILLDGELRILEKLKSDESIDVNRKEDFKPTDLDG